MKKILTKFIKMILNKDWRNVIDFESACKYNNQDYKVLLNKWSMLSTYQVNTLKLEYCIKTINEDWKIDWSNNNQQKWYNWFEFKEALGWRFVSVDLLVDSHLGVGLYYQSKEKAEHGANHFIDMYKIYLG